MSKLRISLLLIIAFVLFFVPFGITETVDETEPILADLGFTFDEFARRSAHGVTYAIDGRNLDKLIVDKSKASQDMQSKVITVLFEDTTVACYLSINPLTGNISSIQVLAMLSPEHTPTSIMEWLFTVSILCPANGQKTRDIGDESIVSDARDWLRLRSNVVSACIGMYQIPLALNSSYVVNDIAFVFTKVDSVYVFNVVPVTTVETNYSVYHK